MQRSVGWREWVSLPELEIEWMKAKIDTGARTSSLHAEDIEIFTDEGVEQVRFVVAPWQESSRDAVPAVAELLDVRTVKSSSGEAEERPVILTSVRIAEIEVAAELTLTRRDQMGFRMLIGREALRQGFLVDPASSYIGGRPPSKVRAKNRQNDDDDE